MLNASSLEKDLTDAFKQYLPIALEQAAKVLIPGESDAASELSKEFGDVASELLAEPLASAIASSIDCYIKGMTIQGTIITTGSPLTQTAVIMPAPSALTAGVIPNTFKIL